MVAAVALGQVGVFEVNCDRSGRNLPCLHAGRQGEVINYNNRLELILMRKLERS